MDENDKKILTELISNSRMPISKKSSKTVIPDSTVSNRIKKLENNNIIEQYTTIINPEAIGIKVIAMIIIQTETEKHENVEIELPKLDKVSQVYSISGEYDILIKVWAHTLEELNDIVNSEIRTIDGIEELRELIVMEKLKEAYLAVNTNADIEIQTSDSTTGVTSTQEGICDIGMASRDLKDTETGVTATTIAQDGIAVIVYNESPVENLTSDLVKSIFTGETTVWADVQ